MLKICVFGKFRVWRDGEQIPDSVWEHRLAIQKLFQILLTEKRAFSEEELMEYLWEEPRASTTLRARISELRRILEPQRKTHAPSRYILQRNTGYCFCWERVDNYWIDADEFDKHYVRAQRYYSQQAWANAAQEYEAAITLYQGDYLAEERYEEWAAGPSRLYREKLLQALDSVADCHARLGRYEKAIAACRHALTHRHEERFYQKLMLWHYLAGNHSEALRAYEECKRVLKEQIDTEPSPETERLYEQIRARRVLDIDKPYPPPKIGRSPIPYALSPGSVPFVGRRAELARLVGYLEQAHQGQGCAVLISGEAGWGKTRLAHELLAYAQRRFQSESLQGRCSHSIAYQPWAEIIREGVQRTVPLPTIQPLWLAEVAQLVPELRTHKPDLPINPELPPQQAQLRFFEGLTQFLLSLVRVNGRSPLLLFLDDLHWADAASLDFLSYFLPRIEQQPILIIGAYRSEEVGEEHPLRKFLQTWEPKGLVHSLALSPWTAHDVHELLQNLPLQVQDAERFAQRLHRESEGVPLFVILTLQHLFETDLLRVEGQAWVAADEVSLADAKKLPLPRAIQELIERRVSWLSEPELEFLQLASVIGREFEYAILQRAWEGDALTALEGLLKAHVVVERQGRYEFSHDKIREVVYEGLSLPRRQLLHRRVLQAFEQVYAGRLEALTGVLARQAYHAGDYKKALEYGVEGLKRAVREYRHGEGLELAEMGLEAAQRLEDEGEDRRYVDEQRFELLSQRVKIYHERGNRAAEEKEIEQVFQMASRLGDLEKLASAYLQRAELLWRTNRFSPAKELAQQALEIQRRVGNQQGAVKSLQVIGNIIAELEGQSAALPYFEESLEIARRLGDETSISSCLSNLTQFYFITGDLAKARQFAEEALRMAQGAQHKRLEGAALNNLGALHNRIGEHARALEFHQRASELFEEIGFLFGQAVALQNSADVHSILHNYDQALQCNLHAIKVYQAINDKQGEAMVLLNIGVMYSNQEDFSKAIEYYDRALPILEILSGSHYIIQCLARKARAHFYLRQPESALQAAARALELLERIGAESVEEPQRVYFEYARALQLHGRESEARPWLEKAYQTMMKQAERIPEAERDKYFERRIPHEIIAAWEQAQSKE